MDNQTEGKKEEGLRGWWVDVSQSFLLVVYENPKYNIIRFYLQEMGKLWRKSAPELMGVELLIMFVLILWLIRISGDYSQEMMWVVMRSKKPSNHIQNCPIMLAEW